MYTELFFFCILLCIQNVCSLYTERVLLFIVVKCVVECVLEYMDKANDTGNRLSRALKTLFMALKAPSGLHYIYTCIS